MTDALQPLPPIEEPQPPPPPKRWYLFVCDSPNPDSHIGQAAGNGYLNGPFTPTIRRATAEDVERFCAARPPRTLEEVEPFFDKLTALQRNTLITLLQERYGE